MCFGYVGGKVWKNDISDIERSRSCIERIGGQGRMNNDLISRSALLEEINNFSMRITGSANAMALVIMDETKKSIMRMVEEQPSVYDIDKNVE